MNNELYHHGILGMHWGKKNGPPYPLDYSQLSKEERYKAIGTAKRKGNIKEAAANRDYYNDRDLQEVINRFRLNQDIDRIMENEINDGKKKVKKLIGTIRTVGDLTGAIATTSKNAINMYNNLDAVYAAAMGEDPKPIRFGGKDKGKNKNKNKNNNWKNDNNKGSYDSYDPSTFKKGSISSYARYYDEPNNKGGKKRKGVKHSAIESYNDIADYYGVKSPADKYDELNELYHHGILGMHWGKRHGPPYPLDSSVSTGKRLKKIRLLRRNERKYSIRLLD